MITPIHIVLRSCTCSYTHWCSCAQIYTHLYTCSHWHLYQWHAQKLVHLVTQSIHSYMCAYSHVQLHDQLLRTLTLTSHTITCLYMTHLCSHAQTHVSNHTFICLHIHTHALTPTLIHLYIYTDSHTLKHIDTHGLTLTDTCSHIHSLWLTHTLTV